MFDTTGKSRGEISMLAFEYKINSVGSSDIAVPILRNRKSARLQLQNIMAQFESSERHETSMETQQSKVVPKVSIISTDGIY